MPSFLDGWLLRLQALSEELDLLQVESGQWRWERFWRELSTYGSSKAYTFECFEEKIPFDNSLYQAIRKKAETGESMNFILEVKSDVMDDYLHKEDEMTVKIRNIASRYRTASATRNIEISLVEVPSIFNGLKFNGSSSYVEIPYSSSLAPTTELSISARFKLERYRDWDRIIAKSAFPAEDYAIELGDNNDVVGVVQVGGTVYLTNRAKVEVNKWYHAVITYLSGDKFRLYLNGEDYGGPTITGNIDDAGGPVNIGRDPNGAYHMKGKIDEVYVYNRCLSNSEVKEEWRGKLPSSSGRVLEMHFSEGSGNVTKDESDNDNDGTLYDTEWVIGFK